MLESIRSYNPIGKRLLVLEHSEQNDSTVVLGIEVLQKNGELDITKNFILQSSTELSNYVKKTQHAGLVITDSNILSKEIHHTGTDKEIISKAYPNLNVDDFYYQILKTSSKSFITLCRKEYVTSVIEQYRKEDIFITKIALGNLKLASLSHFFQNTEIVTYNASVTTNSEEITSIVSVMTNTKEEYQIDDVSIPSSHTLPFAFLFDNFSQESKISGNIEEKNLVLQKQYTESQFFKKTLHYGIGFILISLLINFFVFNTTFKTWQGLQEELQVYATQKETIKTQQSIVAKKEAIVNSIMTTGFSKSSYYMDQIIQIVPSTILLNSFAYQPLVKTIRNDKAIQVEKNEIAITGNSIEKEAFTIWLNTIESLPFVNDVTIMQYGTDKKNKSDFEVTIQIANDTTK